MKKIVKKNHADYLVNLKGNQGSLHADVKDYFEDLEQNGKLTKVEKKTSQNNAQSPQDTSGVACCETLDKEHGRIEKRTYFYSTNIDWLPAKHDWEKLMGIGQVTREVESISEPSKKTIETSYFFGNIDNVTDFAAAARHHWGVKSMHWSLDVTFGDDRNQIQAGVAAENMTTVMRLVFNTLKNEKK